MMRFFLRSILAAIPLAFASMCAQAAGTVVAPSYHITNVAVNVSQNTFPLASEVTGVNKNGEACGYIQTTDLDNPFAFVFKNGVVKVIPGTLPGGIATGINESGQICGQIGNEAFLYSGGVVTQLGFLPGDDSSIAYSINDDGHVLGASNSNIATEAFIYENGTLVDTGLSDDIVSAINDSNEIAGRFSGLEYDGAFTYHNGKVKYIASFGGTVDSDALDINNLGDVVGYYTDSSGNLHAFLYKNGVTITIEPPSPSIATVGIALNDKDDIVGTYQPPDTDGTVPVFAYLSGVTYDLNSLLDSNGVDYTIVEPNSISINGQIGATALVGSECDLLLLTPIDTPLSPGIDDIAPAQGAIAKKGVTLTVNGAGFTSHSYVDWNNTPLPTTYVSTSELTATVSAAVNGALTSYPGSANIVIVNPGGASLPAAFPINAPAPVLKSLSPTKLIAGHASVVLSAYGSDFAEGCTVMFGTTPLTTTFVSTTKLTAAIPATLLKTSGTVNVTVADSGGTSGSVPFTIN